MSVRSSGRVKKTLEQQNSELASPTFRLDDNVPKSASTKSAKRVRKLWKASEHLFLNLDSPTEVVENSLKISVNLSKTPCPAVEETKKKRKIVKARRLLRNNSSALASFNEISAIGSYSELKNELKGRRRKLQKQTHEDIVIPEKEQNDQRQIQEEAVENSDEQRINRKKEDNEWLQKQKEELKKILKNRRNSSPLKQIDDLKSWQNDQMDGEKGDQWLQKEDIDEQLTNHKTEKRKSAPKQKDIDENLSSSQKDEEDGEKDNHHWVQREDIDEQPANQTNGWLQIAATKQKDIEKKRKSSLKQSNVDGEKDNDPWLQMEDTDEHLGKKLKGKRKSSPKPEVMEEDLESPKEDQENVEKIQTENEEFKKTIKKNRKSSLKQKDTDEQLINQSKDPNEENDWLQGDKENEEPDKSLKKRRKSSPKQNNMEENEEAKKKLEEKRKTLKKQELDEERNAEDDLWLPQTNNIFETCISPITEETEMEEEQKQQKKSNSTFDLIETTLGGPISPSTSNPQNDNFSIVTISSTSPSIEEISQFDSSEEDLLPSTSGAVRPPIKRRTYELESSVNDISLLKTASEKDSSRMGSSAENSAAINLHLSKVTLRRKFTIVSSNARLSSVSPPWSEEVKTPPRTSTPRSVKRSHSLLKDVLVKEMPSTNHVTKEVGTPPRTNTQRAVKQSHSLLKDVLIKELPSTSKNHVTKSNVKMPNFAAIHQKALDRMESIVDYKQRTQERAKFLLSGKKPSAENKTPKKQSRKQLRFAPGTSDKKKSLLYIPLPSTPLPKRVPVDSPGTPVGEIRAPLAPKPVGNQENTRINKTGYEGSKFERKILTPKQINHNRLGFTFGNIKAAPPKKKEEIKAMIVTKSKPVTNTAAVRRTAIKGVRSNRRFDLLMQMRKGK